MPLYFIGLPVRDIVIWETELGELNALVKEKLEVAVCKVKVDLLLNLVADVMLQEIWVLTLVKEDDLVIDIVEQETINLVSEMLQPALIIALIVTQKVTNRSNSLEIIMTPNVPRDIPVLYQMVDAHPEEISHHDIVIAPKKEGNDLIDGEVI